jgi:hypothetical protein
MTAGKPKRSTDKLEHVQRAVLGIALVAGVFWALVTSGSAPILLLIT